MSEREGTFACADCGLNDPAECRAQTCTAHRIDRAREGQGTDLRAAMAENTRLRDRLEHLAQESDRRVAAKDNVIVDQERLIVRLERRVEELEASRGA